MAVAAASIPAASVLPLYTPAAAAEILAVRESWLRRRAAARTVPCTFLGKHLRFSHADVVAIAEAGATAAGPPPIAHDGGVRRPAVTGDRPPEISSRAGCPRRGSRASL